MSLLPNFTSIPSVKYSSRVRPLLKSYSELLLTKIKCRLITWPCIIWPLPILLYAFCTSAPTPLLPEFQPLQANLIRGLCSCYYLFLHVLIFSHAGLSLLFRFHPRNLSSKLQPLITQTKVSPSLPLTFQHIQCVCYISFISPSTWKDLASLITSSLYFIHLYSKF